LGAITIGTEAEWATATAAAVWQRLEAAGFAGFDPYDALNATHWPATVLTGPLARRALTQAVKRSPVPLQGALGIAAQADACTLGHALLAATRLAQVGALPGAAGSCAALVEALRAAAISGCDTGSDGSVAGDGRVVGDGGHDAPGVAGAGAGWGYHFPVHTRFFTYEPSTPNLIVTAFVAKALAAATRAGLAAAADDVGEAARFIVRALPRTTDGTGQCFGYVPGEPAVVHNANLLAALVLCEAGELCAEPAWIAGALACARFTVARQAADGSWPYSEERRGRWVDGFHTGFVLEGLSRVARATGDGDLRNALQRGTRFYVAQLFGPGGEPKYLPRRPYPLDALSAAQGVETLHVALAGPAARAVPGQLAWIRRHLVRADGRVAYQVHRGWTDRREFPRWSAAPLMSALAGVAVGAVAALGADAQGADAQGAAVEDEAAC
jgi:polysaccharide biosynthesis protein VpsJ